MVCRTCPYEHPIEQKIFSRRYFWERKEEDEVVKKLLVKAKAERDAANKDGAGRNVAKENLPMEGNDAGEEGDANIENTEQGDVEKVDVGMRNVGKENAAPVTVEKQSCERGDGDGVIGCE